MPALARLGRTHLNVRYDGRGTGLSDRGVADFSLDARVADLEAVVDALGLERFAMFAISAGGPTAIAYASRHPERVTRIVFMASFARGEAVIGRASIWDAIESHMRRGWDADGGAGAQMLSSLLIPEAPATQHRFLSEMLQRATNGPDAASFLDGLRPLDLREELAGLRMPVLAVHATGDLAVPIDAGREIASLVPGARLIMVESPNHASPPTDPAWHRAYEEIGAFLAEDES